MTPKASFAGIIEMAAAKMKLENRAANMAAARKTWQ